MTTGTTSAITAIIKDTPKPIVIAPLHQMEEILRSWDWRPVVNGTSFHGRGDERHPQRKFIDKRKAAA